MIIKALPLLRFSSAAAFVMYKQTEESQLKVNFNMAD